MEARMMNIVLIMRTSPLKLLIVISAAACFLAATPSESAVIKGAYYPAGKLDFPPEFINTTLFTHIFYGFLTPNTQTFKLDVTPAEAILLLSFTSTLKLRGVHTLFSVGGEPSDFALLSASPMSRSSFIRSSISVSRRFGFEGVDFSWEYPQSSTEMDNFGRLLDEWRVEVRREAAATGRPALLLTAAVHYLNVFTTWEGTWSYPAASINRNLDWVNVLNFDYVTGLDMGWATGAHAALYNPGSNKSTSYGMEAWMRAGVARGKLVMGLPMYGRAWELQDPAKGSGIGAPAVPSLGEQWVSYARLARYNKELGESHVVYDPVTVSVYLVVHIAWIGFDDVRSVAVKINYAQQLGLGGYYFSSVVDDYHWELSGKASQLWK